MDYNKFNSDTRERHFIKSPRDVQKRAKVSKEIEAAEELDKQFTEMQEKIAQLEKELADKEAVMKVTKKSEEVPVTTKSTKVNKVKPE